MTPRTAKAQELYHALVNLCQAHGFTTAATYEHLHAAVDSIVEDADEAALHPDHEGSCDNA